MKTTSWKQIVEEPVSPAHEQQVLQSVSSLLRQNAEIASEEEKSRKSRSWILWALPALGAGAVAILLLPRSLPPGAVEDPAAGQMIELAQDYDMYQDLEEIQNLELLRQLGDPDRWVTKKSSPKKS